MHKSFVKKRRLDPATGGWWSTSKSACHRHRLAGCRHKIMVERSIDKAGATLGADKNYDTKDFAAALHLCKVPPHVARKDNGSAIDERTARYTVTAEVSKCANASKKSSGGKAVGPLRQTKFQGLKKDSAQTIFTSAAYSLTRMDAIFG